MKKAVVAPFCPSVVKWHRESCIQYWKVHFKKDFRGQDNIHLWEKQTAGRTECLYFEEVFKGTRALGDISETARVLGASAQPQMAELKQCAQVTAYGYRYRRGFDSEERSSENWNALEKCTSVDLHRAGPLQPEGWSRDSWRMRKFERISDLIL